MEQEDSGIAWARCARQGISGDELGDGHSQWPKTTSAVQGGAGRTQAPETTEPV